MIVLKPDYLDWLIIRQSLACALVTAIPVRIENAYAVMRENPSSLLILDDITRILHELVLGTISELDTDLLFQPESIDYGHYEIVSSDTSSIPEIVMLLLPSLLTKEFRSSLLLSGVSHSPGSYPVNFINETLFSLFEELGFYAHCSLKQFGFTGSGNGIVESKIYPAEKGTEKKFDLKKHINREITGIRASVYVAKMNKALAEREKQLLVSELEIPDSSISIIEIINSRGPGNVIQVFLELENITLVFSRIMDLGTYQIVQESPEELICTTACALAREVRDFLSMGSCPPLIERELIPMLKLSGVDSVPCNTNEKDRKIFDTTREIADILLDGFVFEK